jgi:pre-mRNA-splicing factor SYF1
MFNLNKSNPIKAIKVMEKATIVPKTKSNYYDGNETVQSRLYKSLKLWSMYVDLEESFGSFKVFFLSFNLIFFPKLLN